MMAITKKRGAAATAVLLAAGVLLAGCGATEETAAVKPAVKIMELKKTSLLADVEYPSKVYPSKEINVSSKIPGKVAEVFFDVGDAVKAGDILFTLESDDSRTQLEQSQAALTGTKESIRRQLLEAETSLNQARLQYDDTQNLYDRTRALYDQGATSKQEMDSVETAYKNADLNLKTAQKNLDILNGGGSGGLASAQVNQAQSAVDMAESQVENSVIRSPIDGKVSVCNVKVGELTSSAMQSYTIINSGYMTAEINVPEDVQAKLSKGQTLKIKAGVSGERSYNGTIDTVAPAADSRTGFYKVKILLDNKNGELLPGTFVKAVVPFEKKEGIFTVPGGAVVSENGIEYLYVVSEGTVVRKIINTGISTESAVEVQGDLKEGEEIILEGQSFLDEGEKVDIVREGSQ